MLAPSPTKNQKAGWVSIIDGGTGGNTPQPGLATIFMSIRGEEFLLNQSDLFMERLELSPPLSLRACVSARCDLRVILILSSSPLTKGGEDTQAVGSGIGISNLFVPSNLVVVVVVSFA